MPWLEGVPERGSGLRIQIQIIDDAPEKYLRRLFFERPTMRIFRRKYIKNGAGKTTSTYSCEFKDCKGILRRLALFTDKTASEETARNIERLVNFRYNNTPPDATLSLWLEACPARVMDRLVAFGILEKVYTAGRKETLTHAANWKEALSLTSTSPQYVYESHRHVEVLVQECKWPFLSDIAAEDLRTWLKVRKKAGASVSTLNHYIRSVKSFCYWLAKEKLLSESPIRHIQLQDSKLDVRYKRRALTEVELIRLLAVTRTGKPSHGMTGMERYLFYKFQGTTGIRRSETRGLLRSDFNFETTPATVTIRAEIAKDRLTTTLPLRNDVAKELAEFMADHAPQDRVFKNLRGSRTAEMLRVDLEAASIPHKDALGQVVDCHSFRRTFATLLSRGGVPLVHAQRLMRHKDPRLTAEFYTDVNMDDHTNALAKLPDLTSPPTPDASSSDIKEGV